MTPSALPWWVWALCSAVAAGIAYGIYVYDSQNEKGSGCLAIGVMVVSVLVSILCGIVAVIRFVKWAWIG